MAPSEARLLGLPSELIHHILGFLSLSDLLSIGLVNRALQEHSLQDTLYQPFVQSHVPGARLPKPFNSSWRDLYKKHYPYWFIPEKKIWFADNIHTGKLLIARYDYRMDAIEAYALVAERRPPTLQTWEWNTDAIIHTFSPKIQLDLNAPVVRLDDGGYANAIGEGRRRLQKEILMDLRNAPGLYSRLFLTRPWPVDITRDSTPVWPPLRLPSTVRTRNDSPSHFKDTGHRPSQISEMSTSNFRIRKWLEFSSRPRGIIMPGINMRVGEDITTWATLPEECYTPTAEKPWQGIWCGDYAGHGCEFLAILQPDDPKPLPLRAAWAMRAHEREGSVNSAESWNTESTENTPDAEVENYEFIEHADSADDLEDSVATLQESAYRREAQNLDSSASEDEKTYRGRIEAIKLTGDPNIPRGEYTFIAPDIGPDGLVRVATEEMFRGARIVKSVGHIAAHGFRDDDFIKSQLILISHDRLAQYWEIFGHVSFYQRVNVDDFVQVP
ncbi:hypothetical protein K491DRAFT_676334 [Lophiostoma macrostomum CBS 122681]|uniref:F-box domain-containing protein n=1 Tax=Lophiostoma macrostomum CBS 122681 TaxID=1314788 RepID=A0A6A6TIR3_9PLEO|nr:hypothetical protein K491DRAFT_676334 [Lophiostoma macrostomum CBS 122681]